jgi:hypothetical protein
MSEYKIVNRVAPTPAFAQTQAEVAAEEVLDKSLSLIQEVAQNPEVTKALAEKGLMVDPDVMNNPLPVVTNPMFGYNEKTGMPVVAVPSAANVAKILLSQAHCCFEDMPADLKQPETSPQEQLNELYETLRAEQEERQGLRAGPVSREEFEEFKQSVIEAFKQIGFDTRKWFHE